MAPVRLSELAAALGLPREGEADPLLTGAAGVAEAGAGDITFVASRRFEAMLATTGAGAVIVRPDVACPLPCLRAPDPQAAFAAVLSRFAVPRERLFPTGVHATAVVAPDARLGAGVCVGPYAVIGAGARIGDGCALGAHVVVMPDAELGPRCTVYPHVTVREGCRVGAEVILHAGAVVGSDGFGYVPGPQGLLKIPQIGRAVLEDRVEIGANACIDRAQTEDTVIGAGTKIDNLVQIGHNVRVGRDCALSAQVGISGSSRLGDRVVLGGQAGVADHLTLGDDVKVGAQSGLDRDVPAGGLMFGTPAVEHKRAYRIVALLHRLPELFDRVKKLELAAGGGERERRGDRR